jgi:hypothetical protein
MGVLNGIREKFVTDVVAAVGPLLPAAGSGQHLRAVGLYGLYLDCEELHLPNLTVAIEPENAVPAGDLFDADWNPAEWSDDEPAYESEELEAAVESVTRMMAGGSCAAWDWLERELEELLVRAAREIHAELAGLPGVSPALVVMFYNHDSDDLEGLVRRAVGDVRFRELFPVQAGQHPPRTAGASGAL